MIKMLAIIIVGWGVTSALMEPCAGENVSIPDPGLNAAIRDTLQKPTGALTDEDLLSLTVLDAKNRNISDLGGLGGAHNLALLDLRLNHLTNGSIPAGLISLTNLDLGSNQLSIVTIPPDVSALTFIGVVGNPIITLVLPEPLAAAGMAAELSAIENQGVSVFTYPLEVQLVRLLQLTGAFKCGVKGPPAAYTVLASSNLVNWSELANVTNVLGAINFTDTTAHAAPVRFYKLLRLD